LPLQADPAAAPSKRVRLAKKESSPLPKRAPSLKKEKKDDEDDLEDDIDEGEFCNIVVRCVWQGAS